jgi:hypothetical protein
MIIEPLPASKFEELIKDGANPQSVEIAKAMARDLPPCGFGFDPDGGATLDWHESKERTVSISVSENGVCSYAFLYDTNAGHGTFKWHEFYPPLWALIGAIRHQKDE